MSRSYKRFPGFADSDNGKKWAKNQAARKVRYYTKSLSEGGGYKKLYEQYRICDYHCRKYSYEELKQYLLENPQNWFSRKYKGNNKGFYNEFYKWITK